MEIKFAFIPPGFKKKKKDGVIKRHLHTVDALNSYCNSSLVKCDLNYPIKSIIDYWLGLGN